MPTSRAPRAASAAAALAAAVALTFVAGPPAGATSCAADTDATPAAIASGTEVLAREGGFFDHWSFAVVGTVTAIRTDEREGSPTYGATEIDVRVHGVLGTPTAPPTMTINAADPGWMSGYPFELGRSYFVPLLARSPEGRPNWSGVCDPVTPLDDPAASVDELGRLAGGSGTDFAVPTADADEPPGTDGSPGRGWFTVATSATAVAAALAVLVVARRHPLRPAAPAAAVGAALAVGDGDQRVERGSRTP